MKTVSNLNNCEEEEKSDSVEENGRLESFLDYIEQYEVLLLGGKRNIICL